MKIIVDDREVRSGVIEVLQAKQHITIEIARLSVADYQVDGNLLFERKTFTDLIESIKDNRLFRQGYNLTKSPQTGILILEGRSSDLKASKMRREALQGALIMLTVFFGIPLLRASCLKESVNLMLYTADQRRRIHKTAFNRNGKRSRSLSERKKAAQLYMIQGLPGIGPRLAENLLDQFGSVEAVFNASEKKLAAVAGIGRKTSKKIRWIVQEPAATYF